MSATSLGQKDIPLPLTTASFLLPFRFHCLSFCSQLVPSCLPLSLPCISASGLATCLKLSFLPGPAHRMAWTSRDLGWAGLGCLPLVPGLDTGPPPCPGSEFAGLVMLYL